VGLGLGTGRCQWGGRLVVYNIYIDRLFLVKMILSLGQALKNQL
jgi:hypothetical protein